MAEDFFEALANGDVADVCMIAKALKDAEDEDVVETLKALLFFKTAQIMGTKRGES